MMRSIILLGFVFVSLGLCENRGRLLFAQVMWRHGARAPLAFYPTSLNKLEDFRQNEGGLIEKGFKEHHYLGRRLRQRYIEELSLVSATFKPEEIYVRSTDYNRTIASALSNIHSFYASNASLPVDIHSVKWDEEELFNMFRCQRQMDLHPLFPKAPEFEAFVEAFQPFFAYLSQHSGIVLDIKDPSDYLPLADAFNICDCVLAEANANLPMAPWAQNVVEDCRNYLSHFYGNYYGVYSDAVVNGIKIKDEARRTFSGRLLWEIIDRFQAKLDNYFDSLKSAAMKDLVYYVYSAHDTSLIQLSSVVGFNSVGFDTDIEPETSDAVAIELWVNSDNSTVIKILHFTKTNPVAVDISTKVPGCETTTEGCSLAQFAAKSEKYKIIGTFNEFCSSSVYNTPVEDAVETEEKQSETQNFPTLNLLRFINNYYVPL